MTELTRHIVPAIRRSGRAYPALERALDSLPPDAQRDLLILIRDLTDQAHAAERKARMGLMGRL